MKITLNRLDDDFLFELKNSNGESILLDNTGRKNPKGVSPMESLLMALAGCSGIDMVAILKKQRQRIEKFSAEVEGERKEFKQAKPFSKIHVIFYLEGEVDPKKAQKAAELSFEKYCSVSMTLNPEIEITWNVVVNGEKF